MPLLEGLEACLQAHGGGTIIAVYAQPRASRTSVVGVHDGMLKIALKAPPVDGRANAALLKFLAHHLEVPKGTIELATGASGRRKRVFIPELTPAQIINTLSHA